MPIIERYGKAKVVPDCFKCPVFGQPCDLTQILGDVMVCVIGGLSK